MKKFQPLETQEVAISKIHWLTPFLLSGGLYIYFPAELASGMSPDEYFREFWGKITATLFLGALQWGMVKGLLLVEVLLGKYKKRKGVGQ